MKNEILRFAEQFEVLYLFVSRNYQINWEEMNAIKPTVQTVCCLKKIFKKCFFQTRKEKHILHFFMYILNRKSNWGDFDNVAINVRTQWTQNLFQSE